VLEAGYYGKLTEKQKEYVKDILDAGKHLLSLINDILDISKIEAGKMELNLAEMNLKEVLNNSVLLLKEKANRHGIKLTTDISENIPEKVISDERKIKQILFNLISNALKFTPSGGNVIVSAEKKDSFVEISVTDDGIGIKKENQEKIFFPFTQINPEKEGTGLGLSLSKKMVEILGGEIGVISPPPGQEKGSRFYFTVPLR
jgi:signal transduction histidine kinase